MGRSTGDLMNILNEFDSPRQLDAFAIQAEAASEYSSFSDFLKKQMERTGLAASDVIRLTGIQRNYAYQILDGSKNPGRDKVISFCLALKLSLDDTQRGLTLAGESVLYPKRYRDAVLIYCIHQKLSVIETNALLDEKEQKPLA